MNPTSLDNRNRGRCPPPTARRVQASRQGRRHTRTLFLSQSGRWRWGMVWRIENSSGRRGRRLWVIGVGWPSNYGLLDGEGWTWSTFGDWWWGPDHHRFSDRWNPVRRKLDVVNMLTHCKSCIRRLQNALVFCPWEAKIITQFIALPMCNVVFI